MTRAIHTAPNLLALASLTAVILLIAPAPSSAQPTPGAPSASTQRSARAQSALDRRRQAVEVRSQQAVKSLFSRLCPGRCELVGLDVQMSDPKPSGSIAPGFESVGPQPFEVGPETVTVSVLLDSKLPQNFQSNMARLIEYQLRDVAPEIEVHQEMLDFPTPQNRPMPPPHQQPEPRAQPQRPPQPAELPPLPEPPAEETPEEPADQEPEAAGWAEQMPAIVGALIPWIGLLLVLLLVFALGLVFMRRLAELFFDRAGAQSAEASDAPGAATPRAVDADELRAELERSRSVRNRVLRRWIVDDPARVAELVQLVGPEILSDLKSDEQMAQPLEAVSDALAKAGEPLEDDEAQKLSRETRSRLNAARVVHTGGELEREWAFLEGLSGARLRQILRSCTPAEKLYVVGKLPAPLRASYMEGLGAAERREFFTTSNLEGIGRQEALALSARLRQAVEETSHAGGEVDVRARLMRDLVGTLGIDEQLESVREMTQVRPEVAERLMSMMCLEAAVATVSTDALAEATHQLPVDTLTRFLGGTDEAVARAVLGATPADKRDALETELSLDIPVSRRTFLDARSHVTERLVETMRRDGHDLADANRRALARQPDHQTASPSPQEVPS